MKLMVVEWVDSCALGGVWNKTHEIENLSPSVVLSIGWVLKETKYAITLISHVSGSSACGELCIPRGCIRRTQVVKSKFEVNRE
jgi:hypothetical protein